MNTEKTETWKMAGKLAIRCGVWGSVGFMSGIGAGLLLTRFTNRVIFKIDPKKPTAGGVWPAFYVSPLSKVGLASGLAYATIGRRRHRELVKTLYSQCKSTKALK